jgi:CBS domain-containing protein
MEDPMLISQTLRRSAVAVAPGDTVTAAAGIMDSASVGALAVVDEGRPIGLVTDRDLVRRAMAHRLSPDARVDTVMSTPVITISADADQHDAFAVFRGNAIRRLVVVDADGGFAGMVSVDDLLIDLAAELTDLAQPVTAEVLFGHHDSPVPAVPSGSGR